MKKWLNRIQAWRSGSELRSLQWWERERAYGKSRFILRMTVTYSLTVVGLTDIFDHIFGGSAPSDSLLFKLISYTVMGTIIASFTWDSWERKYKKALLEAQSSGHALPHSAANQISN
jgi:hypothetical protein